MKLYLTNIFFDFLARVGLVQPLKRANIDYQVWGGSLDFNINIDGNEKSVRLDSPSSQILREGLPSPLCHLSHFLIFLYFFLLGTKI